MAQNENETKDVKEVKVKDVKIVGNFEVITTKEVKATNKNEKDFTRRYLRPQPKQSKIVMDEDTLSNLVKALKSGK